jgi:hypothetical protein
LKDNNQQPTTNNEGENIMRRIRRNRRNEIRNFIKDAAACIARLAFELALIALAVFAACFVLGLPEMIGNLIFGA